MKFFNTLSVKKLVVRGSFFFSLILLFYKACGQEAMV